MQEDKKNDSNTGKEFVQTISHQDVPDAQPELTPPKPLQPEPQQLKPPIPTASAEVEPEVEPSEAETSYKPPDATIQPQEQSQTTSPVNDVETLSPPSSAVYTDEYEDALITRDQLSTTKRRKLLKLSALVFFVLVIFIVGILGYETITKSSSVYIRHTLSNSGYKYSLLFDKNATTGTLSGYNELTGYNLSGTNELAVSILKSPYSSNCVSQYALLLTDFEFKIGGVNYPACSVSNGNTIIANFKYKGVWQYADIYSIDGKSPVDTKSAKAILTSVEVH